MKKQMAHAPIFDWIEDRKTAGQVIRGVLHRHGLDPTFDDEQLHVRKDYIAEPSWSNIISDAILGRMFPRLPGPVELLHYTSAEGLAGIARSGELRLFPVRRRINQGEIDTFARSHRLEGYLRSADGEPYFKELSDDLFYTSFTDETTKNELDMWSVFGKGETGARLRVRLTPTKAELRTVLYEPSARTLLNEMNDALADVGMAAFLPWTISRIGAFYLPSTLFVESEARLLVKRHKSIKLPTVRNNEGEYLPIRLAEENEFCRIDVPEVILGRNADKQALTAALDGTVLADAVKLGSSAASTSS
jgi:hypothetical protein